MSNRVLIDYLLILLIPIISRFIETGLTFLQNSPIKKIIIPNYTFNLYILNY